MLKRTLAQVELQQARTADTAELSPRIVIPFLAPLVERSYFSGLGCICRHNIGKHSCTMKESFGVRLLSTGAVVTSVDACGDANKRPSFVFPWGVSWKWVLRALLRTVKR